MLADGLVGIFLLGLDDLQLGFADRLVNLGKIGFRFAANTLHLQQLTRHLRNHVDRNGACLQAIVHAIHFFVHRRDLLVARIQLVRQAFRCLRQLLDAGVQDCDLTVAGLETGFQNVFLERHGSLCFRHIAGQQAFRKINVCASLGFCHKTGFRSLQIEKLGAPDRIVAGRLGRIDLDENIARIDDIAFLDDDFRNDAAFQMLDGLAIAFNRTTPWATTTGQRRSRSPGSKDAESQEHGGIAAAI